MRCARSFVSRRPVHNLNNICLTGLELGSATAQKSILFNYLENRKT
jgi:hypothetical protein